MIASWDQIDLVSGCAATGAVRLCLTVSNSEDSARLRLAEVGKWASNGKAEPFRTGCGKAASAH